MAGQSLLFVTLVEEDGFRQRLWETKPAGTSLPGILAGVAGDGEALVRDRQLRATPSFPSYIH
jgi:hypothetical protein